METDYIDALVRAEDLGKAATADRIKSVTRKWVHDIANDLLPWSEYVASTKLTKEAEQYTMENVATELVRRVAKRDPSRHIAVGDRVSYLVVGQAPGEKAKRKRDTVEEVGECDGTCRWTATPRFPTLRGVR
eukprot:2023854-Pyramimonas_sp.AAC.1